MTLQLRSELLKLRTIRMPIVFLLLALGLALLTVFVDGLTKTLDELATQQEQRRLLGTAKRPKPRTPKSPAPSILAASLSRCSTTTAS